ncbi:hypothetical protein AURDEDRAFT_147027 [Auricularia subglabra TFB-10046 SS5]|nr:hypothetical protein AURDEDRAFT_147027 [Auricularia subglabra TFB-10046 SS5]
MFSKRNAKQQANKATRPDVCKILASVQGAFVELRCYQVGEPVFASLSREFPGAFGLWDFHPGSEEGVYKIRNVGLDLFIVAKRDGQLVVAPGGDPTEFRVQPASDNVVLIKLAQEDKVWTMSGKGARQEVSLEGANGSVEQKFIQLVVDA